MSAGPWIVSARAGGVPGERVLGRVALFQRAILATCSSTHDVPRRPEVDARRIGWCPPAVRPPATASSPMRRRKQIARVRDCRQRTRPEGESGGVPPRRAALSHRFDLPRVPGGPAGRATDSARHRKVPLVDRGRHRDCEVPTGWCRVYLVPVVSGRALSGHRRILRTVGANRSEARQIYPRSQLGLLEGVSWRLGPGLQHEGLSCRVQGASIPARPGAWSDRRSCRLSQWRLRSRQPRRATPRAYSIEEADDPVATVHTHIVVTGRSRDSICARIS